MQGTNTNSKHKLQPMIVNLMLISHVHYCDNHRMMADEDKRTHTGALLAAVWAKHILWFIFWFNCKDASLLAAAAWNLSVPGLNGWLRSEVLMAAANGGSSGDYHKRSTFCDEKSLLCRLFLQNGSISIRYSIYSIKYFCFFDSDD